MVSTMPIGTIDWNEVTAIATGVLALGLIPTAIGIWITYKAATDDLHATQYAAAVAQQAAQVQIEASRLPLLVDVTETTSADSDLDPTSSALLKFPGGHTAETDWRHVYVGYAAGQICVAVPLRNVGSGLAVINPDGVRMHGGGLHPNSLGVTVHRERVPPGETTRILCTYNVQPSDERRDLQMLVPYTDFAGGQATYADVRLALDDQWHVRSVRPVPPENIAP